MASYDQLLAEQPWSSFRPAFSDAWISDLFTMENETLTKALQSSISGDVFSSEMLQSLYSKADTTPVQTPTVSGVSSENEALVSKQQSRSIPPSGRVAKRKPRPSKRPAATTFIAADPENFMQMVQQVTGVRLGGASVPVFKPEPRRATDGLPTLDTSAFLLDSSTSYLMSPPSAAAAAADGGAGSSEHYFDSFCSFPTLESWKAV